MSKFLGPIHNIMFSKITFLEAIEARIVEQAKVDFKDEIESIVINAYAIYGEPVIGKNLEDIIDGSNIHGSLQSFVNNAESRHGYILTNMLETIGEKANALIEEEYRKVGEEVAENDETGIDTTKAVGLHQLINKYILDGMPCDSMNGIMDNSDGEITWRLANQIHSKNFISLGVDKFYGLRGVLISELLNKTNNEFTYSFEVKEMDGFEYLIQNIKN